MIVDGFYGGVELIAIWLSQQRFLKNKLHLFIGFLAQEHEIRAMVWAMIFTISDREDVFQNIAVVLWNKFDRFDRERPFLPWARGVAIREIRKHRKKDVRRRSILSTDALDAVFVACKNTEPVGSERLGTRRVASVR